MNNFVSTLHCDIGKLDIYASNIGVTAVQFNTETQGFPENEITKEACLQLTAYFAKEINKFDLPLDMKGTDFEKNVWDYLLTIPYGTTTNYGTIAKSVSTVKAVRAIGRANGKNPIPIIVPCHRVIGSDHSLVGFALGLDVKLRLLNLENPDGFGKQMVLDL